jgi:hypothetical protein
MAQLIENPLQKTGWHPLGLGDIMDLHWPVGIAVGQLKYRS